MGSVSTRGTGLCRKQVDLNAQGIYIPPRNDDKKNDSFLAHC